MYLKALEMQGFKSFPDRTRLEFEKDITAIVGPNGSGKSNISDAVLWVLGEQRSRALRGGKMEDVIFGGTERRGAMGFAQVSLVMDNTGRYFNMENSEVVISRKYYRSGESEYFINKQSVRLKDIHELLMDTGLGRDGYSIIGQGRIAEIVSARSTDRREIFEEAAGISRYRYRKEESERKLQRTEENLVRINDKIDELEMQVGPLREQAETAKRFLILRDQLRALEVSVWLDNLDKLAERSKVQEAEYAAAKAELDNAHGELEGCYDAVENTSRKMNECDVEAEKQREKLGGAELKIGEYESQRAVLRESLRNNLESIERMKGELEERSGRAKGLEAQIEERRERVESILGEKLEMELKVRETLRFAEEKAEVSDKARTELTELTSRENERLGEKARQTAMLEALDTAKSELEERQTGNAQEREEAEKKRAALASELEAEEKVLSERREKVTELQNVIAGYRLRFDSREKKVQEFQKERVRLEIDGRSMDSRISMLTEMEKEYEGFNRAVKTVMDFSRRGTLRGVHGPVASLLKTNDEHALAIETALGGAVQNIVVDTKEDGRQAIELLKARNAGRATFLPVDTIRGRRLTRTPEAEPGYIGTALELASFDSKYAEIFASLLGRTVVAETLQDAVRLSNKYKNELRIVTLDGQLINPGGSMTGGSVSKGTGILSRANELKRLKSERKALTEKEAKADAELSECEREMNAARYELDVALAEYDDARGEALESETEVSRRELVLKNADGACAALESENTSLTMRLEENGAKAEEGRAKLASAEDALAGLREDIEKLTEGREELERERAELTESLSGLRASLASLEAELTTQHAAIAQMDALLSDMSGDSESRRRAIEELGIRNKDIEEELKAKETLITGQSDIAEGIRGSIAELTQMKLELERKRTELQKQSQERNRELIDMERDCARLEQKKLACEMEEKQIIDKLWDTYELSRTAAIAARQPVENVNKANREIAGLKREITALGSPNIGAIDEFERVNARYTFLAEQRDDIEGAKTELLKIIARITKEMKEIFIREFKQIDATFRLTFRELFGGGKAALILEDEEDVLNCGIEIQVQPPGKAVSTISLLSGGEMAFVAIALYFAILKVRPTPFCIMDEIEAALDEANVTRYADYLRTMSGNTQFIVITHRRGTMEGADMLYGVTMQEKGVSNVISVNLEEASLAAS